MATDESNQGHSMGGVPSSSVRRARFPRMCLVKASKSSSDEVCGYPLPSFQLTRNAGIFFHFARDCRCLLQRSRIERTIAVTREVVGRLSSYFNGKYVPVVTPAE